MTEILEKALMIGFGIIILLFFLSIASPFFKLIENYKYDSDLKKNLMCISIINSGINDTINNPSLNFSIIIELPENFSLLASGNEIKYSFILDNVEYIYNYKFVYEFSSFFYNEPGSYILKINIIAEMIYLNFI